MSMPGIRPTTSPALPLETADRRRPSSRMAVTPVHLEREVEADRRRSLREELEAAEEHLPQSSSGEPEADAHEVVEELGRLGTEALRVLQPIGPEARRLAHGPHIDEQA
jgi:hypothetical protein